MTSYERHQHARGTKTQFIQSIWIQSWAMPFTGYKTGNTSYLCYSYNSNTFTIKRFIRFCAGFTNTELSMSIILNIFPYIYINNCKHPNTNSLFGNIAHMTPEKTWSRSFYSSKISRFPASPRYLLMLSNCETLMWNTLCFISFFFPVEILYR